MTEVGETVHEQIHFDTLWSTVLEALELYAGETWTARGEHDPGVILLQALCFGIADLAYRHTLPLNDLLTPESANQKGTDIFAAAFGPETALTCAPVTLNDMRRALIDIAAPDGASRLFDHVVVEPDVKSVIQYGYSNKRDTLQFHSEDADEITPFYFDPGAYLAQALTRDPAITEKQIQQVWKKQQASGKLERSLGERGICAILPIADTPTSIFSVGKLIIELHDDVPTDRIPDLVAGVMWAVEHWMLPRPVVETAEERIRRGEPAESVYDGPCLTRGWITHMSEPQVSKSIDLDDLCAHLMSSPSIRNVKWHGNDPTADTMNAPRGRFWLDPHGMLLTRYQDPASLYPTLAVLQRDRATTLDDSFVAALQDSLARRRNEWRDRELELASAPIRKIPYGHYRHPGWYRSVGELLPAVFGLHQDSLSGTSVEANLLRFLRPFEQWLADAADQLAMLPQTLSFHGRDESNESVKVWGGSSWPTQEHDPVVLAQSQTVLTPTVMANLQDHVKQASKDDGKELSILDYLLGYFGESDSSHYLLQWGAEDLVRIRRSRQGFLRQITRLGYGRAVASSIEVSALQRRIAARMGVAYELFDGEGLQQDKVQWTDLPFIVIEHHELFPVPPKSMEWQRVRIDEKDNNRLYLDSGDASPRTGQLIELRLLGSEGLPMMADIESVDEQILTIRPSDPSQWARMCTKGGIEEWQWRFSPTWLRRPTFYCNAAADQAVMKIDVGRAIPVGLKKGQRLTFKGGSPEIIEATIADIDEVNNTLQVKAYKPGLTGDNRLEGDNWLKNEADYIFSVPYDEDLFSFAITVVLNRTWLDRSRNNPYAVAGQIRQIVREETPSHLHVNVQWSTAFEEFALFYRPWLANGKSFDDDAYRLLTLLGIGQHPTRDLFQ
ncbi:hypothetical protein DF039_34665 [Burkholderia cenocepacia]|nr:hypothetical protein DF039_34665 [Burkholderia cenocepacia]